MKQYHDLLEDILENGYEKMDRTGVGTIGVFGRQLRFDLQKGFPLLTTKKTHFKSIAVELLWFLKGSTNIEYLQENGVSIWDEWADERGELGPIYGSQWREWAAFHPDDEYSGAITKDQILQVVHDIKNNPFSRRHIVSAWNVGEIDNMALPPCHMMFQFNVRPNSSGEPVYLDCHMYQRSADTFLGAPFNIASYALLTHMIAHVTDLLVGDLVISFGDAHIYKNHLPQVQELLSRNELPLPDLVLSPDVRDIDDFVLDDIRIMDYKHHPAIKAEVAV